MLTQAGRRSYSYNDRHHEHRSTELGSMTCINQASEPDHPIPLVAFYDKRSRLLWQAWVAEDLFYPEIFTG